MVYLYDRNASAYWIYLIYTETCLWHLYHKWHKFNNDRISVENSVIVLQIEISPKLMLPLVSLDIIIFNPHHCSQLNITLLSAEELFASSDLNQTSLRKEYSVLENYYLRINSNKITKVLKYCYTNVTKFLFVLWLLYWISFLSFFLQFLQLFSRYHSLEGKPTLHLSTSSPMSNVSIWSLWLLSS